jgi:anaerobic nitric oxide reductase flavorubredoxin
MKEETKKTSNKIITIPNIISVFRIVLVIIATYLLVKEDNINAFILYVTAMITDFLDGFLARLLNQSSELGKLLDPVADKLLVLSIVLVLFFQNRMPLWIVIVILARDFIILSGGLLLRTKVKFIPSSILIGKISAVAIMLVCALNILISYQMELIPDVPVYCTANGIKSLKGYYHKDWNFVPVKTGDVLDLGDSKITFVEATMLHWPDQLMAYFDKDEILFSSDAFGQHFATEFMYDDAKKIDMSELLFEAIKYYANIVAPYSSRVTQKLEEIKGFNLPVKIIAPSHGVMWRENPNLILEKYAKWADSYKEDQITIIYDTMYGSTRRMAECIAEGIRAVTPETTVKLFHFATADNSDVITEVFRSKAILVGSPTYNSGILSSIAALLEELKGMRLSGKKAAAFGSYGWAPISTKVIAKMLSDANFELMDPDNVKASWNPNEEAIKECVEFGKKFAEFAK